jgi:hypothetical protein
MSYRILSAFASVVALTSAGQAFSQTFRFEGMPATWERGRISTLDVKITSGTCLDDQIATNDLAMARIDWADKCGIVSKEKWTNFYLDNADPFTRVVTHRDKYTYPIFAHDDSAAANTYPVWVPDYKTCEIPADIVFFTLCSSH